MYHKSKHYQTTLVYPLTCWGLSSGTEFMTKGTMVCEISMWQTKQRNDTHKTRKLPYLIDRLIYQVWTWSWWWSLIVKKTILNFKWISNDNIYSKFNISTTLSLEFIKAPPRNPIHQGLYKKNHDLVPFIYLFIIFLNFSWQK